MFAYMPRFEKFFHYRNLDVSTLKELARRWAPAVYKGFEKKSRHEALADIYESIDELKYREHFSRSDGPGASVPPAFRSPPCRLAIRFPDPRGRAPGAGCRPAADAAGGRGCGPLCGGPDRARYAGAGLGRPRQQ